MELDKESTESGSHGLNSDLDSPPTSGNDDIDATDLGDLGGDSGGVVGEMTNMDNASVGTVQKNAGEETNNSNSNSNVAVVSFGIGGGETAMGKKKRGRPRKYDQDGKLTAAYLNRPRATAAQPGFTLSTPPSSYEYSSSGRKRGRGGKGYYGSGGNWQSLASLGDLFASTAGGDFIPHIVTAYTGEDVASKILTFAQKGSRGICVLSANGSVSNVMLRQPGTSGGLLTYEGRFEILTLSGSFTVFENGGIKSRNGGLSVSLASPDGRVIGGGVAGMLMAASPIQIVLGSFTPTAGFKPKKKRTPQSEPRMLASPMVQSAPLTVTAAVPISQAAPEHSVFQVPPQQLQVQHNHAEGGQGLRDKDHPNLNSTNATNYEWNAASGSISNQGPCSNMDSSVPVVEN